MSVSWPDDNNVTRGQLAAAGGEVGFAAAALYVSRRHAVAADIDEQRSWSNVYASLLLLFEAIAVIQTLELLNGLGAPNTGDNFNDASVTFSDDIQGILHGAGPTHWSGAGQDEYDHQNHEQQCRMRVIARADRWVAQALNNQAQCVEQVRKMFADCRLGFIGATGVLAAGVALWERYQVTGNFVLADALAAALARFTVALIIPVVAILGYVLYQLMEIASKTGNYIQENVTNLYQLLVDDVHDTVPLGCS